eukprot:5204345-Amphidinium_carterae.1
MEQRSAARPITTPAAAQVLCSSMSTSAIRCCKSSAQQRRGHPSHRTSRKAIQSHSIRNQHASKSISTKGICTLLGGMSSDDLLKDNLRCESWRPLMYVFIGLFKQAARNKCPLDHANMTEMIHREAFEEGPLNKAA